MSQTFTNVPTRLNLGPEPEDNLDSILSFLHRLISTLQASYQQTAVALNGIVGAAVLANRPVPSPSSPLPIGATFYATDVSHFYAWDGTNWNQII